ncbi:MAG: cobalamin biosynthesis protein [Pseudomonadales bacterium]|nr:cobalamin biosynthesis protein [Pseudomonadales bacterium]
MTFCTVLLALILDKLLGETQKWHPLVGFGVWVNRIEARLNQPTRSRRKGVIAVILAVVPFTLISFVLDDLSKHSEWSHLLISSFILYIAIGWRSLIEHSESIVGPLMEGNIDNARAEIAKIVSRDTSNLNESDISKAATESVLENGADAIFSAIFWFCVLGIPGVVIYRLSNTLDAMWGYKSERYFLFGWAAARLDDVLNFIPARFTAISYALAGNFNTAISCWSSQATSWKSPNAGPVMSAGAGALNVSLGGKATYHGKEQIRPLLGPPEDRTTQADLRSIQQACKLINNSLLLWLMAIAIIGFVL